MGDNSGESELCNRAEIIMVYDSEAIWRRFLFVYISAPFNLIKETNRESGYTTQRLNTFYLLGLLTRAHGRGNGGAKRDVKKDNSGKTRGEERRRGRGRDGKGDGVGYKERTCRAHFRSRVRSTGGS